MTDWKQISSANTSLLAALAHEHPREDGEALFDYLERLNIEAGAIPMAREFLSPGLWERYKDDPRAKKGGECTPVLTRRPRESNPAPPPETSLPYKDPDDEAPLPEWAKQEKTDESREREAAPRSEGDTRGGGRDQGREPDPPPKSQGTARGRRKAGRSNRDVPRHREGRGRDVVVDDPEPVEPPSPRASVHPLQREGDAPPGDFDVYEDEEEEFI